MLSSLLSFWHFNRREAPDASGCPQQKSPHLRRVFWWLRGDAAIRPWRLCDSGRRWFVLIWWFGLNLSEIHGNSPDSVFLFWLISLGRFLKQAQVLVFPLAVFFLQPAVVERKVGKYGKTVYCCSHSGKKSKPCCGRPRYGV